jgi:ABC-type multidrug transport system fused ATPase/permease subunit
LKNGQPYLSLDFGADIGRYVFLTNDEASSWVTEQKTDWGWLSSLNTNPTNNAWNNFHNYLNGALNSLRDASNAEAQNQQSTQFIQSAKGNIQSAFQNTSLLLPNSSSRQFIFDLKQNGSTLEAGLVAAYLMGQDLRDAPFNKSLSALVQYEFFTKGIKDRAKGEAATLKKLSADMTNALAEHKLIGQHNQESFATLSSEFSNALIGNDETFKAAQTDRDEQWNEKLAEAKQDLEALTKTYDEHMALAAPVAYWEAKRKKHRNWSAATFALIAVGMIYFGNLLVTELENVGKAVSVLKVATSPSPTASAAPASSAVSQVADIVSTGKIGSFILLATLGFWIIRILVRLFLSHIHLENDAAERVTMAKTYLALKRDSALPSEDSIGTILAALFRPTGDGIVKDEGLPPTAMEWMTKLGGKN